MAAIKTTTPSRKMLTAKSVVVPMQPHEISLSAAMPALAIAATETIVAEPVAAEPATTNLAMIETTAVEAASVDAREVEDVVGVSPVVKAITNNLAELPERISSVVTELNKTQSEVVSHMDNAMKSAEEIVSFGQGNLEAIMKSSQIWAAGLQDLGKHFAATAQAQLDETMATVKTLSSVKSLKEAMEIQSTLAKAAMEKMMAETGKMTDASMKLAEQTMAPITARVTLATEKFARTA